MANHRLFFFNETPSTEIYTLSLHDALPISMIEGLLPAAARARQLTPRTLLTGMMLALADGRPAHLTRVHAADRKSTRLNSSHSQISYAVFCLKKKNTNNMHLLPI